MLTVSDFSFVACGMATVAATVGYVCAKKLRQEPSPRMEEDPTRLSDQEIKDDVRLPAPKEESPASTGDSASKADILPQNSPNAPSIEAMAPPQENVDEATVAAQPFGSAALHAPQASSGPNLEPVIVLPILVPTSTTTAERRQSLKRKQMHDHDENNMPLEYPYNLTALYPNKRNKTPPRETVTDDDKNTPVPVVQSAIFSEKVKPAMQLETKPQQGCAVEVNEPRSLEPTPSLPEPSKVKAPVERSNGALDPGTTSTANTNQICKPTPILLPASVAFEAFASSQSSLRFGSAGSLASGANARPVWSTSSSFRKRYGFVDNVDDDPELSQPGSRSQSPCHAIESSPPAALSTYSHSTGEEDEETKCELKGAKLFVKRGGNEFSGGMLGHVKLLSNRQTLDERLLFRREPLWKVSMNTRLRPSVRCTFDSEECVLRLVLAESVTQNGFGEVKREIVVYALKPGRFCPKREFQDFAQSVMASKNLCSMDDART